MLRIAYPLILLAAVLGLSACAKDRGPASKSPGATAVLPSPDSNNQTVTTPHAEELVDFAGLSDDALGQRLDDPRAQAELSWRFQQTRPLRLVVSDGQLALQGVDDFERRDELLVRLVDFYFLKRDLLSGAGKDHVEAVFGPGTPDPAASAGADRYVWDAGRDLLVVEYRNHQVVFAAFLSE